MELRIREPFFSHNIRALTFVFMEKNMKLSKEKDFCFYRKKNCILLFVFMEERKRIHFFVFQIDVRKHILSLYGFPGREFSHRERNKKKKPFYFYFNNASFWVVLKLLETASLISLIYCVGSDQPI